MDGPHWNGQEVAGKPATKGFLRRMWNSASLICALIMVVSVAHAAPDTDCKSVMDDKARLECYDKANGALSNPVAPTTRNVTYLLNAEVKNGSSSPQALGEADLDTMHVTFLENVARFVRDYVGKNFHAALVLNSVKQNTVSDNEYEVSFGHGVMCLIKDAKTIDFIASSKNGDRVLVAGRVFHHSSGNIELEKCSIGATR